MRWTGTCERGGQLCFVSGTQGKNPSADEVKYGKPRCKSRCGSKLKDLTEMTHFNTQGRAA